MTRTYYSKHFGDKGTAYNYWASALSINKQHTAANETVLNHHEIILIAFNTKDSQIHYALNSK